MGLKVTGLVLTLASTPRPEFCSRATSSSCPPAIHNAASTVKTNSVKIPLSIDDFASLFQILR
jgi:hypothetical protein